MRYIDLPSGETVPVLGQGTWGMGEGGSPEAEAAALRLGIDLGMTLIDSAEMYGEGGAEEVVGAAVAGHRDEVFLVSKVYPHNATRTGTVAACERSLRRLRTDHLDLYLLHWRGGARLAETLEAFCALRQSGKIRHFGVSNFDPGDMREWWQLAGGSETVTDQVLYNLTRRGIEWDLLPWCREHDVPVMAYSPIEQGRMLRHPTLRELARRRSATPAQIALAWLLHSDNVFAVPKAVRPEHVRENAAALDLTLTEAELIELDKAFPPPTGPRPLEML
jgi:diketogulonate reductase-like aldo/keto reductase